MTCSSRRALALAVLACTLAACQPQTAPDPATPKPAAGAPAAPTSPVPVPGGDAPADAPAREPDMPTLRVKTVTGEDYDLAARRGRWVVVNFWATWCAPCLKEMPELSALDAMREHVEVIGLAYEEIEPDAMRAFLRKHPVVYPVAVIDVYDPPADFATPAGLPMTYLIAPDGRVAKKFLGPVTAKEIEARIAEAGGPAVDAAAGG